MKRKKYANMRSDGGVDETETDHLMEQLLSTTKSTDLVVPPSRRSPSPGFFEGLSLPGFNYNDYLCGSSPSSSRRGGPLIVSNTPRSPSMSSDIFASLSSLSDGCLEDFMDFDSGALHGSSSPSSSRPGGIKLIPVINWKEVILAHFFLKQLNSLGMTEEVRELKVLPTEKIWGAFHHLWIDFMEALKLEGKKEKVLVPPLRKRIKQLLIIMTAEHNPAQWLRIADDAESMAVTQTIDLFLQAERKRTTDELAFDKIIQLGRALPFALKRDLAQLKTMMGCSIQDFAFVETINLSRNEKFNFTLEFIHLPQPDISPFEFISDQAKSGNQKGLLLDSDNGLHGSSLSSSHCGGNFIPRNTFQIQELSSAAEAFLDNSSDFTTSETFESRDALERWCRNCGRRNGFEVVVARSDSGKGTKKERVTLVCERSGSYRGKGKNTELHQDKKLTTTATKKCECPFKLNCQKTTDGAWTVQVICGNHNHQCSAGFENLELQREKMPSCNIPSIGGQDEASRQMFESSLIAYEGDPREQNRFQPNFGEGSSQLKTVNASNVESRETPTSQIAPGGMLTFSDPAQNQGMATLPHTVPRSTAMQYERITGVKATYREEKVKLPLSSLSRFVQLEEQVALRLGLKLGSFKVEYQEHEDRFLIACDEVLQECVEFSSSLPNRQINLLVTNRVANQLNG